jgi:hypothetical protein
MIELGVSAIDTTQSERSSNSSQSTFAFLDAPTAVFYEKRTFLANFAQDQNSRIRVQSCERNQNNERDLDDLRIARLK